MDRVRHKRNYDLHSWTGVCLGFFLFVVCFTGSLALFFNEVQGWEDPAMRTPLIEETAPVNAKFTAMLDGFEQDGGDVEFLNMRFPTDLEPYYQVYAHVDYEDREHEDHLVRWHPYTLELLPEREDGAVRWIYDFHRDLMWPAQLGGRTIGRGLVGIAGVILLLSIISGVVAHTKIREEIFTLRYIRSVRLKWQDTHKVIGLWGLPFFGMIALTGAVLGIVTLLAPVIAVLAFKGDQQALFDAVIGQPPEATGQQVQMLSMDEIRAMQHPELEGQPLYVVMHNYGDANATFDVYYKPETKLLYAEALSINGATGEPVVNPSVNQTLPGSRVVASMSPLHYGTYGGIALKVLYFILGIGLSIITALGTMMWIERRLHGNEGTKKERFYRGLTRLNIGVCTGLSVACSGVLVHGLLYNGAEAARLWWTGLSFFVIWFAALGYAFIRRGEYRANADLLSLTGALLITAAVLNIALTSHTPWFGLLGEGHAPTAWTDLTFLVLGGLVIASAQALPKERRKWVRNAKPKTATAAVPAE